MADAVLALEAVTVTVAPGQVVGPAHISVAKGALVALVGPNGSGKTTLLRAAVGLTPHGGQVFASGRPLGSQSAAERARCVAYVPQQSRLEAPLAVERVVELGAEAGVHRADARAAAVRDALASVDASGLVGRRFDALSLGERRRVLLARALATGAPALVLDEPDAYLDVAQRVRLFETLRRCATEGRGLLVVVHSLAEACLEADHVVVVAEGRVVAQGAPSVALDDETLRTAFGVRRERHAADRFHLPERT